MGCKGIEHSQEIFHPALLLWTRAGEANKIKAGCELYFDIEYQLNVNILTDRQTDGHINKTTVR